MLQRYHDAGIEIVTIGTSTTEQIRDAGIPVVVIEYQTTLAGIETKINQLAEILGVPAEGQALADRVNGEIAEAQALAASATSHFTSWRLQPLRQRSRRPPCEWS